MPKPDEKTKELIKIFQRNSFEFRNYSLEYIEGAPVITWMFQSHRYGLEIIKFFERFNSQKKYFDSKKKFSEEKVERLVRENLCFGSQDIESIEPKYPIEHQVMGGVDVWKMPSDYGDDYFNPAYRHMKSIEEMNVREEPKDFIGKIAQRVLKALKYKVD